MVLKICCSQGCCHIKWQFKKGHNSWITKLVEEIKQCWRLMDGWLLQKGFREPMGTKWLLLHSCQMRKIHTFTDSFSFWVKTGLISGKVYEKWGHRKQSKQALMSYNGYYSTMSCSEWYNVSLQHCLVHRQIITHTCFKSQKGCFNQYWKMPLYIGRSMGF